MAEEAASRIGEMVDFLEEEAGEVDFLVDMEEEVVEIAAANGESLVLFT